MKRFTRSLALMMSLSAALSLAACNGNGGNAYSKPSQGETSSAKPTDRFNNSGLPEKPTVDAKAPETGAKVPCAKTPEKGATTIVPCNSPDAQYRVTAGQGYGGTVPAQCSKTEFAVQIQGRASCLQVNARAGDCIDAPDPNSKAPARRVSCDDPAASAGGRVLVTRVNWDTKDDSICGRKDVRYIFSSEKNNGVLCMVDPE